MSESPEFWAWVNMLRRCLYKKHPSFKSYGARGITVHAPWIAGFAAFLADVGKRPSKAHSLERINNNKGYEPGNVKWATRKEQMTNTRSNHWIEIDGEKNTLRGWAQLKDIHETTIIHRIERGMSERDAVLTPPRLGGRRATKKAAA